MVKVDMFRPKVVFSIVIAIALITAAMAPIRPRGVMAADDGSVQVEKLDPCPKVRPCEVAPSHYIAIPPTHWNGKDRLQVAVWMHGYARSAAIVAKNKKLLAEFNVRNILLVAPSGLEKTWSFPGAPSEGRDDVGFIERVLADVNRRFPVRTDNRIAAGFSLGGSFVWTIACQRPDLFHYHIAFAGGFWRPHPKECATGLTNLVHIHGEADRVVPLLGRPIGRSWYQGDIPRGLKFWRRSKHCQPMQAAISGPAKLTCKIAGACGNDTDRHGMIASCRHDGGHLVKPIWLAFALDELLKE